MIFSICFCKSAAQKSARRLPPNLPALKPGVNIQKLLLLCSLALFLGVSGANCADLKSCPGITESVFDVTLSLPAQGIVSTVRFKPGEFVQTNDVILELDDQLEQIEVERRKCIMENHKTDWESTKIVFEKSASVSRDELLKKEADYKVALAEYQEAQEQLRRRHLVAPGAGVLCEIKLHVGEAYAPYAAVVRIVDTRRCYFISDVPARFSAKLKPDQTVQLEIEDADSPIKVAGRIVFISPVVDAASGLQTIKAVFENVDGKVRPGLAGKIILGEAKS
jgi:RND family efflux transporter MFP subunit